MARTLAQERSSVRSVAGLTKATPAEIDDLINEGHKELCVRSEWTRAAVDLGPTVADQAAYALPETIYRPLEVEVDGTPYDASSEGEVKRILNGTLRLAAAGLWWISEDDAGAEFISLYPTPAAGLTITARSIVYPADIAAGDDDATFRVPDDSVKGIRAYVKRELYSGVEDDEDRATIQDQHFENEVTRLRQRRFSRVGRGNVHMRVEGWTA